MRSFCLVILIFFLIYSCSKGECPSDMVELKSDSGSFCIDRYENYIIGYDKDGQSYRYAPKFESVIKKDGKFFPGNIFNKSELKDKIYARNAKGMIPTDNISWIEAEIACKNSGKRLCKAEEWDFACMGREKKKYPYGNEYQEEICNSFEFGKKRGIIEVMPSGFFGGCKSESGVFDLSGNLWEWIDGTDESKTLKLVKGGGFSNSGYDEDVMSCHKKRFQPPNVRLSGVGFRCCRDR
ncbi:MAG: formylglycine-generating enzyme family protein [Deltaproteobacteria bacterium]|nr:formylglycine-generating enzyme family protein [Deltaproteobacteria bacterium]